MQYVRYVLWKWILDDRILWILILVCALGIGAAIGFLVRDRSKPGSGVAPTIIFALVATPVLWWYFLNLADHKTPLPTPAGFDFVKEVGQGKASCIHVNESVLVIQISVCGFADVAAQDRVISEIQNRRPSHDNKPVVVTFLEDRWRTLASGAKTWAGYRIIRQELLPARTNPRLQGGARLKRNVSAHHEGDRAQA